MKSQRSNLLAERLEQGAQALATLASGLSDAEWQTRLPRDGRKIGVVMHHVASVYPVEIHLAETLGEGKPVTGVVMDNIHEMNAGHARDNDGVTKEETVASASPQQRGSGRGNPRARRRAARSCSIGIVVCGCADHVPVHARGSRRAPQLSPPGRDPCGVEQVALAAGSL